MKPSSVLGSGLGLRRGLTSQFALDGLGTGGKCLLDLGLKQSGIAHRVGVHFEFDAAAGARAAVVGATDFLVEADAEFQGHGISPMGLNLKGKREMGAAGRGECQVGWLVGTDCRRKRCDGTREINRCRGSVDNEGPPVIRTDTRIK